MTHVAVIGAGPAGVMAALRAADLGARTTLLTSGPFGGMAASDGPVPSGDAGHGAAMATAPAVVRAAGRYVAAPVDDDGVGALIEALVLAPEAEAFRNGERLAAEAPAGLDADSRDDADPSAAATTARR